MSVTQIFRWHDGALNRLWQYDLSDATIAAADSWLVSDGVVLALDLHRQRFLAAVGDTNADAAAFWEAVVAEIPHDGDFFPRVELQLRAASTPLFVLRLRSAPERTSSVRLITNPEPDPRTAPMVKGPDTLALSRLRTAAEHAGADDAVILSADGYVVETASSALLWWRGEILCAPASELERVDSVTARSVITLATALGVEVYYESVTPSELDGVELWTLNALHGIRIATAWIDGPAMAELPGRLRAWRTRLDRLRRELP